MYGRAAPGARKPCPLLAAIRPEKLGPGERTTAAMRDRQGTGAGDGRWLMLRATVGTPAFAQPGQCTPCPHRPRRPGRPSRALAYGRASLTIFRDPAACPGLLHLPPPTCKAFAPDSGKPFDGKVRPQRT